MKSSTSIPPRALDHIVLPVLSLETARARHEALGFTVAPDGLHPFGTENCCIYFDDDTMMEPLAIAHRETCEAAAFSGNTFVRNDQTFRFRRGDEGFSHVVLKSADAVSDDATFRAQAMSDGEMVEFTRKFASDDGQSGVVSVSLAFAADQRAPDAKFFTCEDRSTPRDAKPDLRLHANGATGIVEIICSEPNPTDFQYFLQTLLNQREVEADSFGMSVPLESSQVTVLSPDGLRALYGVEAERSERGLRFEGVGISVKDIAKTRANLEAAGVAFSERLGKLIVNSAPGQGYFIAFSEHSL